MNFATGPNIVELRNEPFPLAVIDYLYSPAELYSIRSEAIAALSKLIENYDPLATKPATRDNRSLKNNMSYWVDDAYPDSRDSSSILRIGRKLFSRETADLLMPGGWFFNDGLSSTYKDSTLISYYGQGAYYEKHKDDGLVTALTWMCAEPIAFSGGALTFDDYRITVEFCHGRSVIFPSAIAHAVSPVESLRQSGPWDLRMTMTQFAWIGK